MKSVLVTGGAGYIGSQTCKVLAKSGYLPVTYDSLVTGHKWAVKWGPFEHGDILDQTRLMTVLSVHKPIAVIHFAASAYVGESMVDPAKYYRNNVAGTLSLLECLKLSGVQRFVFSSTCATYGVPDRLPIIETTPQNPINPYGRSKLMIEAILRDYSRAIGLACVALRYFNAAGADLDTEIGETHDPETHLIPLVLQAAADSQKHVTIYGTDYPTADGSCVRDYVHVNDLAKAHECALGFTARQPGFESFNLGTGSGYSVRQVIDKAISTTGHSVAIKIGPRRPGDPAELVASPVKAAEILDWRPTHSDLETIVRTAWSWLNR